MFKHAIVKTPAASMVDGITTAGLGLPDYKLALQQHQNYIKALQDCGLKVKVLPAEDAFPDACFVEDAAVVTPRCVIITNPGASSRKAETGAIQFALSEYFDAFEYITGEGTLDGGDVMMVGDHYYIGLSARTNLKGANQMLAILQQHGLTGSTVEMSQMLHLKTGLSYLENNHLLVTGEFKGNSAFADFKCWEVDDDEAYAANCIWVNNRVVMPKGFPKTQAMLQGAGFEVVPVEVSEFEKLDGGLSCLSLRF